MGNKSQVGSLERRILALAGSLGIARALGRAGSNSPAWVGELLNAGKSQLLLPARFDFCQVKYFKTIPSNRREPKAASVL